MLNRFDDYPIHQTNFPIAHPVSGDLNYYDRYFFHGYPFSGEYFFCASLGVYPNRRIMDAHFSIVHQGRQYALHVSRLAPQERTETRVGPFSVQINEPMRTLRLVVEPNKETTLECDLTFHAATIPIEEQTMTRSFGTYKMMETSRFAQFGHWEGYIVVDGKRITLTKETSYACRDRSWGVRPVGQGAPGAPGPMPQLFWLWAPIHLKDRCAMLIVDEDSDGRPKNVKAEIVPKYTDKSKIPDDFEKEVRHGKVISHNVDWIPGTRRSQGAELIIQMDGEKETRVTLEPLCTFQLLSLGYLHPQWGHAFWKGEYAIEGEVWELDKLDPMAFHHIHVEQVCRIRFGDEEAVGVLEQLVLGPAKQYRFESLIDGYRKP